MTRSSNLIGVDCEKCSRFTGQSEWPQVWGCAKGHAGEARVTLHRAQGCKDFKAALRDELIFRRFKSQASFHGDEALKSRQIQARRAANDLSKSLAEFGELMDGDQVRAGSEAVAALNRLADDIERAARAAKAFKTQEDARREGESKRAGDELAARLMGDWTEAEVIERAQQLAAFDTYEGARWLEGRRGSSVLTEQALWWPNDLAQRLRSARTEQRRAELYAELRRALAESLQTLERPIGPRYATRADFDAWTSYLRERMAAKASVVAVLANASVAARGELP